MSQRKRVEQSRKKRPNWITLLAIIAAIAVVIFALFPTKQSRKEPTVIIPIQPTEQTFQFSVDEAKQLVNDLLTATGPSDPANSYMTPFMKEKIQWIWDEYSAGRLKIEAIGFELRNSD